MCKVVVLVCGERQRACKQGLCAGSSKGFPLRLGSVFEEEGGRLEAFTEAK